eukprot:jgi/Botrbrau1/3661/Bobra.0204s0051.1
MPLRGPAAREDEKWVAFVGNLSQEVSDSDQEGKGFDIMWFGDSITETLRGSCIGEPWAVAEGAPEVLQDFFGQYHSGIMGICADKVGNLWWRLLNGGLPQKRFPKLAIVLIGTNDLTAADCHHDPQGSDGCRPARCRQDRGGGGSDTLEDALDGGRDPRDPASRGRDREGAPDMVMAQPIHACHQRHELQTQQLCHVNRARALCKLRRCSHGGTRGAEPRVSA